MCVMCAERKMRAALPERSAQSSLRKVEAMLRATKLTQSEGRRLRLLDLRFREALSSRTAYKTTF